MRCSGVTGTVEAIIMSQGPQSRPRDPLVAPLPRVRLSESCDLIRIQQVRREIPFLKEVRPMRLIKCHSRIIAGHGLIRAARNATDGQITGRDGGADDVLAASFSATFTERFCRPAAADSATVTAGTRR